MSRQNPAAAPDARINVSWKPNGAWSRCALPSKFSNIPRDAVSGIVEFAIAWVLNNSAVSSAIVGPRTEAQWDAYTGALDVKITAEDEAFIDSLVTSGHSSTPGFNDVQPLCLGARRSLVVECCWGERQRVLTERGCGAASQPNTGKPARHRDRRNFMA